MKELSDLGGGDWKGSKNPFDGSGGGINGGGGVGGLEMVQDQDLEVLLLLMVGEKYYYCYCLLVFVCPLIDSINFSRHNQFLVCLALVLSGHLLTSFPNFMFSEKRTDYWILCIKSRNIFKNKLQRVLSS